MTRRTSTRKLPDSMQTVFDEHAIAVVQAPRRSDAVALRLDVLAYMADMLSELHAMADEKGCGTLADILEVARREARLQQQSE